MSRRRREEGDPGVGSDSFLDVIANIVGILIILIVVAGVRVSRAPVVVPPAEPVAPAAAAAEHPAPVASPAGSDSEPTAPLAQVAEPTPSLAEMAVSAATNPHAAPAEPPMPLRIEPAPELVQRVADLEEELAGLAAAISSIGQQTAVTDRTRDDQAQAAVSARTELDAELSRQASEEQRLSARERELAATVATLEQRRKILAAAETRQPEVQPIRHRLTAVSHTVDGPELHFHVHRGRIAYVPVDELVELLKADINRQKDWLARVPRHEGRVGPVDGFSMGYVVERQSMSILDELRIGGAVRIAVSEWRIIPEADFPSESAAEALAPGSGFVRRLRMTELDTALTFWVYPDSFAAFRQLQELARAEGFTVAARPLPEGTPIAASPQGTRSAGQ